MRASATPTASPSIPTPARAWAAPIREATAPPSATEPERRPPAGGQRRPITSRIALRRASTPSPSRRSSDPPKPRTRPAANAPPRVAGGQSGGGDPTRPDAAQDLAVVHAARQERSQVKSGVRAVDGQEIAQPRADPLDEGIPATEIELAHPAQVPREVALAQEVGEHGLAERRREEVQGLAQPDEGAPQGGRHHDVADPQRGEQHLAEGSDVDHARRRGSMPCSAPSGRLA